MKLDETIRHENGSLRKVEKYFLWEFFFFEWQDSDLYEMTSAEGAHKQFNGLFQAYNGDLQGPQRN